MSDVLAKLGVAALVFVLGLVAGLKLQAWRFDAQEKARLEQQIRDERAEVERVTKIAQDIGLALGREAQARARDRHNWNQEREALRHARIELAQPQGTGLTIPLADARLSPDAVRLWNGALCLGLPAAECPGRADGAAGPAGPASFLAALENHADNAETCNGLRAQVRGWQDWARRVGVAR